MHSYIDMHCDSLLRVLTAGEESLYNGSGMQGIQRMAEAGQMCQFFAIFFCPEWLRQGEQQVNRVFEYKGLKKLAEVKEYSESSWDEWYFITLRNALYRQIDVHSEKVAMAHNYAQIQTNRRSGKASAILTIEDGRMVGGCMKKLTELYEKGVRAVTLTWNRSNCFGYPHSTDKKVMGKGLTAFGREAIKEMNRLGILIDVSHLSDGGFFDVAALSDKPFVASHSNCRGLVPHTRNLSDDMIVLLAERGGVAGVNLYPPFVMPVRKKEQDLLFVRHKESMYASRNEQVSEYIEALAMHVLHFMNVGGEECVGIGTDFDGMEEVPEIDCPEKMERLFEVLLKKGMTPRQLDKFVSGNVLRVVKETMK